MKQFAPRPHSQETAVWGGDSNSASLIRAYAPSLLVDIIFVIIISISSLNRLEKVKFILDKDGFRGWVRETEN